MPSDAPSPSDGDPIAIAIRVARAIEAAGGAYFLGGSLASSLQGEPRATNDIDIVIDLAARDIHRLTIALGSDFEVDVDVLRRALVTRASCNIFYLPMVTKVDLFAVGREPYDQIEFARRREILVRPPAGMLFVKAPEDTVLRKLMWHRDGGGVSDRQWRDVVEVLRVSGSEMDSHYVTTWAERLGLAEQLAKARNDSEQ